MYTTCQKKTHKIWDRKDADIEKCQYEYSWIKVSEVDVSYITSWLGRLNLKIPDNVLSCGKKNKN